jgi:hypothetical protein
LDGFEPAAGEALLAEVWNRNVGGGALLAGFWKTTDGGDGLLAALLNGPDWGFREVLLKKLHENVHVTGVQNRFGSFTAKERFWH